MKAFVLLLALTACAVDEPRYGSSSQDEQTQDCYDQWGNWIPCDTGGNGGGGGWGGGGGSCPSSCTVNSDCWPCGADYRCHTTGGVHGCEYMPMPNP